MKRQITFIAVILLAAGLFARTIQVPTQPRSQFLDTEVSKTVKLHNGQTDTHDFKFDMRFEGNPTNNLEIAFGIDVNTNGVLDVEEVETTYSWRAGRFVIEDVLRWNEYVCEQSEDVSGTIFSVTINQSKGKMPGKFSAVCAGAPAFADFNTNPPAWLFRREWTHMRVVRRGVDIPSDWIACEIEYPSFAISIR